MHKCLHALLLLKIKRTAAMITLHSGNYFQFNNLYFGGAYQSAYRCQNNK